MGVRFSLHLQSSSNGLELLRVSWFTIRLRNRNRGSNPPETLPTFLYFTPLWIMQFGTANRLKPGSFEGSTPFSGTILFQLIELAIGYDKRNPKEGGGDKILK
jgi:hypothetical protein